jgi:ABC-2 type transport system ATP-binding protein
METASRAEGLPKQFGTVRALGGLDLEVRAGEVFEYLGPNSAGKTTTILLLLGMLRPTPGRAEIFGLDAQLDTVAAHQGRRSPGLPAEVPTPRGYLQHMLTAHVAGGS